MRSKPSLASQMVGRWGGRLKSPAPRRFGRHRLQDAIGVRGPAVGAPETLDTALESASSGDAAAAVLQLQSNPSGLTESEATHRLAHFGLNEVGRERPQSWWSRLWHCYRNPFNLLLTVFATISYLGADLRATIVIGCMVSLSTLIRFVQEGRSHRAAKSLKALVNNTGTAIRRGGKSVALTTGLMPGQCEIAIRDLVPGDLVVLSAGDIIPADGRVLTAGDPFVSQAAMTGESLPVEKFVDRRVKTAKSHRLLPTRASSCGSITPVMVHPTAWCSTQAISSIPNRMPWLG